MLELLPLLVVILLGLLVELAYVIRLLATAWFLRRQKVKDSEIQKWALAQAKKERVNPLVKIIAAWRNGSS